MSTTNNEKYSKIMAVFFENVSSDGSSALRSLNERDWTLDLCRRAVIHNGRALKHIPTDLLTQELCDIAVGVRVEGNSHLARARQLAYYMNGMIRAIPIRYRSYEICMAIASHKNSDLSISEVPYRYRTLEICLKIIGGDETGVPISNGDVLNFIWRKNDWLRFIPPEVQATPQILEFLKHTLYLSGSTLKYLHVQSNELLMHVIRRCPSVLQYCRVQTPELCMLALECAVADAGEYDARQLIPHIHKEIGSNNEISMFISNRYPMLACRLAGLTIDAFIQTLNKVGTHYKRPWIQSFDELTRDQSLAICRYSNNEDTFDVINVKHVTYVVWNVVVDIVLMLMSVNLSNLSIVEVCSEFMTLRENHILEYPVMTYSKLWNIVNMVRNFRTNIEICGCVN